jgi:hypothetical protein
MMRTTVRHASPQTARVPRGVALQRRCDHALVPPLAAHDFGAVDVFASGPPVGEIEDPIHAPMVEQFRREQGIPLESDSPGEPAQEPSDAEIKYRLIPQMAAQQAAAQQAPASVVYVSFQNAMPPDAPDHTQANPGPAGTGANRAGFTRVTVQKHASVAWDTGPAQADGRVPLFAQSVNTFYRLDPILVFVSSDYADGTCPYRVTLQHEREHVEAFARIFHAARARLVTDLETLGAPTRSAPLLVAPANVETEQNNFGVRLRAAIVAHSANVVSDMEADRNAKDSPAAYAVVHGRCPAGEW